MNMISVFGYDEYCPCDGMSDLIALVNNHGGGNVDAQGNLLPDVLAQVLQLADNRRYDYVTVMHLRPDGTPGRTEYWRSRYVAQDTTLQAGQVRFDAFTAYELQSRTESLPSVPVLA
jgi:hypothetical protein